MRRIWCLIVPALLCLAAQSPDGLKVSSVRAWAPSDVVKPVLIEVTVKNTGSEVESDRTVRVHLAPKRLGAPVIIMPPPTQDLSAPVDIDAPLPPLKPGETRVLEIGTPYHSASTFTSTSGSFTLDSLIEGDPSGFQVRYTVTVEPKS